MKRPMTRLLQALAAVSATACGPQQMADQPKYEAYEASPRFPDRQSALTPPPGALPATLDVITPAEPPVLTEALIRRGRERYDIYCWPCHGRYADGDGPVVADYGFPRPPSLHIERLRETSDAHFWRVITEGYGVMYSYAARVSPRDRWAVIGYVRALQLARHADVNRHPVLREELEQAGVD